ncbi:MAG: ABC transporter ATP-binding protein [Lachnospiraceae bacterium]|nr:ABC transporter ATP-binding protein [Lachnospiraceae bacterium]
MNKYVIETEGLTKKYNTQIAVDRLNLHVPKGKIYALLGRNGAGKTTTMKMLLNLIEPTSGKLCLFGENLSNSSKKNYHRIGSIIEAPTFYENLTAKENLEILARLRGRHRKDTIEHALVVVNLDKEDKKLFREYSLGMKQRLGLAAAIMHEPELLILDEPMNGLDPIGIHETRNYLLQLCKEEGTTILISSHVLDEIEQLADVIGIINKGKLLKETNLQELYKHSRRYAEFEVSDVNKAAMVLECQFHISDYAIMDNGILRLYDRLDSRADINSFFVKEGIAVANVSIGTGKLEDYFAELVGGDGIG